jgi:hypothetical protein
MFPKDQPLTLRLFQTHDVISTALVVLDSATSAGLPYLASLRCEPYLSSIAAITLR